MNARNVLAGLALLLLSGCGSLRVQVDVVDPEYVRAQVSDEALRQVFRRVLKSNPGDFGNEVDKNFHDFQVQVVVLSRRYEELAATYQSPARASIEASADSMRVAVIGGSLAAAKDRFVALLERKAAEIRSSAPATSWNGRGDIPSVVRQQLVSFLSSSKQFASLQIIDLREIAVDVNTVAAGASDKQSVSSSAAPVSKALVKQQALAEATAQKSIIQGAELSNTEYAYVVASTPETLWHPRYNEAVGTGTFGNVDVVIRMNSTADFSVKGMRFDASTVAQVASKVLTQSVLLGAQIAGVPVSRASTGTQSGGDALSKQSADLDASDQALASRYAMVQAQKSAIRSAARSILGVTSQLEGGLKDKAPSDASRKAVHDSVQSTIDSLKPQLTLQALQ